MLAFSSSMRCTKFSRGMPSGLGIRSGCAASAAVYSWIAVACSCVLVEVRETAVRLVLQNNATHKGMKYGITLSLLWGVKVSYRDNKARVSWLMKRDKGLPFYVCPAPAAGWPVSVDGATGEEQGVLAGDGSSSRSTASRYQPSKMLRWASDRRRGERLKTW